MSYLSSPVPDLAATLHTQAADEADEANVSFLRDSLESLESLDQGTRRGNYVDPQRDPRREGYQDPSQSAPTSQNSQETAEDLSRRERLQRILTRLNRLHEPAAPTGLAYSNRTPSPNRQSIYDWAPSYDDRNPPSDNELDAILNELRRQQPDMHPEILRVPSQTRRERESNETPAPSSVGQTSTEARQRIRERERERRRRETEWINLRTRAALQRSRREGSPSTTARMLRYVMERERSGLSEEEERARGSGWFRPSPSREAGEERRRMELNAEGRERERQERVEAFRRGYLAENVASRLPRISTPPAHAASTPCMFLENAMKYLSKLRSCSRYEDSFDIAIDHGLATKEFFADKHDDFIMDLECMPAIPYSSWLQPGTVFEGEQYAGNGSSASTLHARNSTHTVEQINPNYGPRANLDHPPGSTHVAPFDAQRPWLSHTFVPPRSKHPTSEPACDHWPVRVILHSIDPLTMTLQGTMEAYDVPQHPSNLSILPSTTSDRSVPRAGKKHAPITTYLEGQILDLRNWSFLTPSPSSPKSTGPGDVCFPAASTAIDASNWRKLPPFNALASDDETARLFLSQARMQEVNEQYIFMRWKERCFVHPRDSTCPSSTAGDQDRGHGLTISGFYYVSLRRSDGLVEGLYYDPCSTPFQRLRLKGTQVGWPAFGFT